MKSGEKWIANMWITAPFGTDPATPSIFLNRKDFEMAEGKAKERSAEAPPPKFGDGIVVDNEAMIKQEL